MTLPISDKTLNRAHILVSIVALVFGPLLTYATMQATQGKDIERQREITADHELRVRSLEKERGELLVAIGDLRTTIRNLNERLDRGGK